MTLGKDVHVHMLILSMTSRSTLLHVEIQGGLFNRELQPPSMISAVSGIFPASFISIDKEFSVTADNCLVSPQ